MRSEESDLPSIKDRADQSLTTQDYIKAATRDNTRKAYREAIKHYEQVWGGFLPASGTDIANYLTKYAEKHSIATLRQRLAALSQWHRSQGFVDPTKDEIIKKVLRGIENCHSKEQKQAKPIQIEVLSQVCAWADTQPLTLQMARDKAILLVGFWRGLRSADLCNLYVSTNNPQSTVYIKGRKTVIGGEAVALPQLPKLCPTQAYSQWLEVSGLQSGPVFRKIDRWGNLANESLNPNSIIPIIRNMFELSNVEGFELFTSHSMRRGFATWVNQNGWSLKQLMEYVGWKNPSSAARYIDINIASHENLKNILLEKQ